jgi:hypothetical protein
MAWILVALIATLVASHEPVAAQTEPHTHGFTPLPEVTVSGAVELVRPAGLDGCELCEACSDCRGVHCGSAS